MPNLKLNLFFYNSFMQKSKSTAQSIITSLTNQGLELCAVLCAVPQNLTHILHTAYNNQKNKRKSQCKTIPQKPT